MRERERENGPDLRLLVTCLAQLGLHDVHGGDGVMAVDSVEVADCYCREVHLREGFI